MENEMEVKYFSEYRIMVSDFFFGDRFISIIVSFCDFFIYRKILSSKECLI